MEAAAHQPFVDDLTEEVCLTLLASHHVGRIAFVGDDDYPVVMPVNYTVDHRDIVLRTDRGETFEYAPVHRVAFEVDEFDERTQTGWSLLVRGAARDVTGSANATLDSQIWAPGERQHTLAIRIERITGRQIVRPYATATGPR